MADMTKNATSGKQKKSLGNGLKEAPQNKQPSCQPTVKSSEHQPHGAMRQHERNAHDCVEEPLEHELPASVNSAQCDSEAECHAGHHEILQESNTEIEASKSLSDSYESRARDVIAKVEFMTQHAVACKASMTRLAAHLQNVCGVVEAAQGALAENDGSSTLAESRSEIVAVEVEASVLESAARVHQTEWYQLYTPTTTSDIGASAKSEGAANSVSSAHSFDCNIQQAWACPRAFDKWLLDTKSKDSS
jgi:hypothetical protein